MKDNLPRKDEKIKKKKNENEKLNVSRSVVVGTFSNKAKTALMLAWTQVSTNKVIDTWLTEVKLFM